MSFTYSHFSSLLKIVSTFRNLLIRMHTHIARTHSHTLFPSKCRRIHKSAKSWEGTLHVFFVCAEFGSLFIDSEQHKNENERVPLTVFLWKASRTSEVKKCREREKCCAIRFDRYFIQFFFSLPLPFSITSNGSILQFIHTALQLLINDNVY